MPLLKGRTKKDLRENIRRLRREGYSRSQASAIAYGIVRKSARDAGVRRPSWVKAPPKRKTLKRMSSSKRRRRRGQHATDIVTPRIVTIEVKRRKKAPKRRRPRPR